MLVHRIRQAGKSADAVSDPLELAVWHRITGSQVVEDRLEPLHAR